MGGTWSRASQKTAWVRLTDFYGIIVPQSDVASEIVERIPLTLPPARLVSMCRQTAVLHGSPEPVDVILVGWIKQIQEVSVEEGVINASETFDVEGDVPEASTIKPFFSHHFEEEDMEALEEETDKLNVEVDKYSPVSTRFTVIN